MAMTTAARALMSLAMAGTLVGGLAAGAGAAAPSTAAPAPAHAHTQRHETNQAERIAALRRDVEQDRDQVQALWPKAGTHARDRAAPHLKQADAAQDAAAKADEQIQDVLHRLKDAKGQQRKDLLPQLHALRHTLIHLLQTDDRQLQAAIHALTGEGGASAMSSASGKTSN